MKKPAYKHIDAIIRGQRLLQTGIDVANKPKLSKSIQEDVVLFGEVRDILLHIIENPTLPFFNAYYNDEIPFLGRIENEPNGAF